MGRLGLGGAVPARTGIGQCYLDGVVFGSGKAAADRDIVRLGDGVSIGLAGVDDVCAVLVCCNRAAHGVGKRKRRIRRISGKLHLVRRQGSEGHVLIHVLVRDDDPARLGLITVLADRVGVHPGGDRILAVDAGDGCTAGILQDDRAVLRAGDIEGDGVDGGNGKVFQLDIIIAGTAEGQRQFIALLQHRAECLPLRFIVGCQECLAPVLYSEFVRRIRAFIPIGKILEGHNARLSRRQLHSRCAIAFFALQIVPTSSPYRFKAVSCAVFCGDALQAGKEIVKGQRLDELQDHGLARLDLKTPGQGIAAIQDSRVGICARRQPAVGAIARIGLDAAGLDDDVRFTLNALRPGDPEVNAERLRRLQFHRPGRIAAHHAYGTRLRHIAELLHGVGVGRIPVRDVGVHAVLAGLTGSGARSLFHRHLCVSGHDGECDDWELDEGDILHMIPGRHGDGVRGRLIALLGDGVGVLARLHRVHTIAAGDSFAVRIFQRDSCTGNFTGGDRQRVQRGNGEVFQPNTITAGIHRVVLRICDRNFVARFYFYRLIRPVNSPSFRQQLFTVLFYRNFI